MSQGEPLTSKVNSPARGNGAEDHGTHPQRGAQAGQRWQEERGTETSPSRGLGEQQQESPGSRLTVLARNRVGGDVSGYGVSAGCMGYHGYRCHLKLGAY